MISKGMNKASMNSAGTVRTYYAIAPDGTMFHRKSTNYSYVHAVATKGHKELPVPGWQCLHWCRDIQQANRIKDKISKMWSNTVIVDAAEVQ